VLAGFLITVGDGMPVSISFGSAVAVVPSNIVIGGGIGALLAPPLSRLLTRLIVRPRAQNADDTVAAPVTVTT